MKPANLPSVQTGDHKIAANCLAVGRAIGRFALALNGATSPLRRWLDYNAWLAELMPGATFKAQLCDEMIPLRKGSFWREVIHRCPVW